MDKSENRIEVKEDNSSESLSLKPLVIFKTDVDKYGRDITAMSDFFEGYVQQMSLSLKEQPGLEIVSEIPIENIGIINDVVHQASIIMRGNITLLPDFENLPADIRKKLHDGVYTVGESRQVDGNLRAVILDENEVRVKDITLKKVISNPGNIETVRNIGNQLQMRQIYTKLADIQEFQTYQLEKDRDRDIIVPFLDARSLVLEAETKESQEEKMQLLKEADGKIRTALNAIYADMETTSKSFAKKASIPFLHFGKQLNSYMGYLTSDMQVAAKYVGVRMQLLEYMGETNTSKSVLQQYQHVMYDFLTKPITKKGQSAVGLLHDYYPYDKSNMNCWFSFSQEMKPALEEGIHSLELSKKGNGINEAYIVSVEDLDHEGK